MYLDSFEALREDRKQRSNIKTHELAKLLFMVDFVAVNGAHE